MSLALFRELVRGAAIIAVVSLVGLVCVSVSRTSAKYDWVGKVLGRGGGYAWARMWPRLFLVYVCLEEGKKGKMDGPWQDMKSACRLLGGRGRAGGRIRLRWSWIEDGD